MLRDIEKRLIKIEETIQEPEKIIYFFRWMSARDVYKKALNDCLTVEAAAKRVGTDVSTLLRVAKEKPPVHTLTEEERAGLKPGMNFFFRNS